MMESIFKLGKKIVSILVSPFEDIGTNEGLTEQNLKAFLQAKGIKDFLHYRYYEEIEDIGIYTLSDGRMGFCYRIYPSSFLGENAEVEIQSLIDSIAIDGTVIQFVSFASSNLSLQIDEYEQLHTCDVNVKNRNAVVELIKDRANYLRKWSKESYAKGMDLRIKDYVNIVSVLFPKGTEKQTVVDEYDALKASLSSFNPMNFPANSLVTLLREFFHNEKGSDDWNSNYDSYKSIDSQIVGGGLKVNTDDKKHKKGFVINDKNYVTTLTTQEFPTSPITIDDFNGLFFDRMGNEVKVPIGGSFICSLTVIKRDVDVIRAKTLSKLRSDLGEIRRMPLKMIEANPVLNDRLKEIQGQISALTLHNEVPLSAMWTLTLFDTDLRKLNSSTAAIKNKFNISGWKIIEESFNNISLLSTLYSLPLQYHEEVEKLVKRFDILFKSNTSSITPIIGDIKGYGRKFFPLVGRTGQLQWFDPYSSDSNYNIAAMGFSGSGKSFTFSDFSINALGANAKVRIIDSLPSYKRIAEMVGGDYIDFDDSTPMCLNFFTDILTKRDPDTGEELYIESDDGSKFPIIEEEDIATIIPMIGMMCGVNIVAAGSSLASDILTSTKTRYLSQCFEEAVIESFKRRGRNAGMADVAEYLSEIMEKERTNQNPDHVSVLVSVITSLKPYSSVDGSYYGYFNGVNNMDLSSDYMVIELSKLESKGVIYPIILMAIANQIVSEFFNDPERYKVLIIDEFWKFIGNTIVISFTEELARKVRKMNGLLITITQSIKDYFANDSVISLYENCAWKWMLKQPASSLDMASKSGRLSLGLFLQRLLKTIKPRDGFGEFSIVSEDSFMISRLKVDPVSLWMYSTNPKHKENIALAKSSFGINEVEAAKFCAYKNENVEASDNDVLSAIGVLDSRDADAIEREKSRRREFVKNMLLRTLEIRNPVLFANELHTVEKEWYKDEITSNIKGEGDELISPFEFIPIAEEEHMIIQYDMIVAKKAIDLYSVKRKAFSINVSEQLFLDSSSLNELIEYIKKSFCEDYITIEVPLRNITVEEHKDALERAKKIKKAGIKFSNDNVDLEASAQSIVGIPMDYMKINGSITTKLRNDKTAWSFAKMLLLFAKSNGTKVCFVFVDSEDSVLAAKEIGADLIEGHYVSKPRRLG